jgi:hypothetical protein
LDLIYYPFFSASLFGAQKPATSIFGQPAAAQPSTSLFGSTATILNKPLFGGTTTAATGSMFGGSTGFGGFGTAAPAAAPTTSIIGSVCVFFWTFEYHFLFFNFFSLDLRFTITTNHNFIRCATSSYYNICWTIWLNNSIWWCSWDNKHNRNWSIWSTTTS